MRFPPAPPPHPTHPAAPPPPPRLRRNTSIRRSLSQGEKEFVQPSRDVDDSRPDGFCQEHPAEEQPFFFFFFSFSYFQIIYRRKSAGGPTPGRALNVRRRERLRGESEVLPEQRRLSIIQRSVAPLASSRSGVKLSCQGCLSDFPHHAGAP